MVSLTNQARLLAAQAFNKKVLEEKARAKQAEIEAERQAELKKLTRRKEEQLAKARNQVEAQRIRDSIAQDLKSAGVQKKIKQINQEAQRKQERSTQKAFGASASRIGVLTGFEAQKDTKGRVVGISKRESKTRKNTKKLLLREIQFQARKAQEETDLERFLKNEQRLNSGNITRKELNKQIQARKAKGLSKTPAQKRAAARLQLEEDRASLSARNRRKASRGLRGKQITDVNALIALKRFEAGRAEEDQLGSSPFADPLFNFGGRSKQEVIARGGTFGRRVGGESIGSQLSFINRAKKATTTGRINFAQGLLNNLDFSGSSQKQLLNIVGSQKEDKKGNIKQTPLAPPTFEQVLRQGQGFFTTEAKPVTKPTLTKGQRGRRVARRKAEDLAKATKAREQIQATKAQTARFQQRNADDLSRISANLLEFNTRRGREIESTVRRPRISRGQAGFVENQRIQTRDALGRQFADQQIADFGIDLSQLGAPQGQVTRQRNVGADPTQLSLVDRVPAFDPIGQDQGRGFIAFGGNEGLTRDESLAVAGDRRTQAEARQRETDALRAQGGRTADDFTGFGRADIGDDFTILNSGLVRATGERGRSVVTSAPAPVRAPQAISVGLSENLGIGDSVGIDGIFGSTPAPSPREAIITETQRRNQQPDPIRIGDEGRSNEEIFGGIGEGIGNIGSGIQSFFAFEGVQRPSGSRIRQGVAGAVQQGVSGIGSLFNFDVNLSQGARVGGVSQSSLDREIAKNLGFGGF